MSTIISLCGCRNLFLDYLFWFTLFCIIFPEMTPYIMYQIVKHTWRRTLPICNKGTKQVADRRCSYNVTVCHATVTISYACVLVKAVLYLTPSPCTHVHDGGRTLRAFGVSFVHVSLSFSGSCRHGAIPSMNHVLRDGNRKRRSSGSSTTPVNLED